MTVARKGSRRIVVDGVQFRWKVRSRPTYLAEDADVERQLV